MIINIQGFLGENRQIEPKLLSDGVGVTSLNQKPGRGDLRPWRKPLTVAAVPAGRKTIFRMGRDVISDSNYWLSWLGVVHAVRGFDARDTSERTYYTGDGAPKVTDNTMALSATPYPSTSRPLGIPAPTAALTVSNNSNSAATGANTSNYYFYTYINDWGWESGNSPISALNTRKSDETAVLNGFSSAPAGNYFITGIRIYKSVSGSSGNASFFFLRDIAIGITTTIDDNRKLGTTSEIIGWGPPPSDLTFLTAMWNGMLAGISGNSVRMCESYVPYAWPDAYEIVPPDAKPIGLGVAGQALLVLTTNKPLIVAGSSPDSMDQMPMEEFSQGCVSARSIVSLGSGVAWASMDGLCYWDKGASQILTAGIMLREDWLKLKPETIIGQKYEGAYLGSYDDGSGSRKAFLIAPGQNSGMYFLSQGYEAMHFDELQDQLYALDTTSVKRWDADPTFMTTTFRSKPYQFSKPMNFGAFKVIASVWPVTLSFYAGSQLIYSIQVSNSDAGRLPKGFKSDLWQFEIQTTGAVQSLLVSQSLEELNRA